MIVQVKREADIYTRLREKRRRWLRPTLYEEAADEIWRLRERLATANLALLQMSHHNRWSTGREILNRQACLALAHEALFKWPPRMPRRKARYRWSLGDAAPTSPAPPPGTHGTGRPPPAA